MSEQKDNNNSEMIRFGERPGPELGSVDGGAPAPEAFGPPVAEGFVPPPGGDEPEELKDAKRGKEQGKKGKKPKKKKDRKKKGADGAAGKKGPPRLLILVAIIAVVFILVIAAVLLILKPWEPRGSSGDDPPEVSESEPAETEEPPASPEPTPTPPPTPTPEPQGITIQEGVDFVRELNPSVLGLEGEDMDAYGVFSGERVVLVDGIPCMEVDVYSDDNPTGSNDIQGRYLLSRSVPRRLFRLDTDTNEVTEVPLNGR